MSERVLVVGDVHGQLETLRRLLRGCGVLDDRGRWSGGWATLVLVGDLVDRGPEGVGVLELVMDLQDQAPHTGGRVLAVLGNHDIQLVAAWRFGDLRRPGSDETFLQYWRKYGGIDTDLEKLTSRHVAWLEGLPAMARVGDDLLVHADSPVYLRYGADLDSLNAAFRAVMQSGDPDQYDPLIRALVTRRFFEGEAGAARLDAMFERFGGRRVIHGHTPIARLTDQPPTSVTGPLISTDGRVVNVDHGLYLGGSGFVFDATESVSISQEIAT